MQWCQHLEADYGMDPCIWQSLDGPSFRHSSKFCLCNSFHGCFVPISRKGQSVHTLVFVLLEFHVSRKLYLTSSIQKMWYIYTMEYYSAIKKNEFMKFLGKWMDLEGIILSEVTQSQRNSHNMYSLISGY